MHPEQLQGGLPRRCERCQRAIECVPCAATGIIVRMVSSTLHTEQRSRCILTMQLLPHERHEQTGRRSDATAAAPPITSVLRTARAVEFPSWRRRVLGARRVVDNSAAVEPRTVAESEINAEQVEAEAGGVLAIAEESATTWLRCAFRSLHGRCVDPLLRSSSGSSTEWYLRLTLPVE